MSEPTMQTMAQRLDHMERENRRWKWIVTVTVAVIATAILVVDQAIPPKVAKVLEAERFIIRDTDGNSRAELGLIDDASVLMLIAKDGKLGVALSVLPNGPRRLSLLDRDGRTRSVLTARANGDSGLQLFDKNRTHRASLDVRADGRPILRLTRADSKNPAQVPQVPHKKQFGLERVSRIAMELGRQEFDRPGRQSM